MRVPAKIIKLASALPEISDYFNGRRTFQPEIPDNILVFFRRHSRLGKTPPFAHHRFVLIFNFQTSATIFVNGSPIVLPEKYALLLFPYQSHAFLHQRQWRRWLFITFEAVSGHAYLPLQNKPVPIPLSAYSKLQELLMLYQAPVALCRANRIALWLALILDDLVHVVPPSGNTTGFSWPTESSKLVQLVLHFINNNLRQRLTYAAISRQTGVSTSSLHRLFRRHLRTTLGRYIRRVKISRAMHMLSKTDMRVKQIADELGFASTVTFNEMFHREVGLAPTAYRRQQTVIPTKARPVH